MAGPLEAEREPAGAREQINEARAGLQRACDLVRQERRDGVAHLNEAGTSSTGESIGIREALQASRFPDRDKPGGGRMYETAVPRTVEVGGDRVARAIRSESAVVGTATAFASSG